jgi:hypothetical protein
MMCEASPTDRSQHLDRQARNGEIRAGYCDRRYSRRTAGAHAMMRKYNCCAVLVERSQENTLASH